MNDLDIEILAGVPFMTTNAVSLRPSKQQIIIRDSDVLCYGSSIPYSILNRVRRTQAVVLRSLSTSAIGPGDYLK